jgi:hypothetical protein
LISCLVNYCCCYTLHAVTIINLSDKRNVNIKREFFLPPKMKNKNILGICLQKE